MKLRQVNIFLDERIRQANITVKGDIYIPRDSIGETRRGEALWDQGQILHTAVVNVELF
jgi:hypothetical protein